MTDQKGKFDEMKLAAREAGIPDISAKEADELAALWVGLDAALKPPALEEIKPSFKRISDSKDSRPGGRPFREILKSTPGWVWMAGVAAVMVFGVLTLQSMMMRATLEQMEVQLKQMRSSMILASLHSSSAVERLDGLLQLSDGKIGDKALIRAVMKRMEFDTNTNVRLASVRTLSSYADDPVVLDTLENAVRKERSLLVALEMLDLLRSKRPTQAESLWQDIREDSLFSPLLEKEARQSLEPSIKNI